MDMAEGRALSLKNLCNIQVRNTVLLRPQSFNGVFSSGDTGGNETGNKGHEHAYRHKDEPTLPGQCCKPLYTGKGCDYDICGNKEK